MNTILMVAFMMAFFILMAWLGSIIGAAIGKGLALLYFAWSERNRK